MVDRGSAVRAAIIIFTLSLSACGTVKYVEKPVAVPVEKVVKEHIDQSLLLPCPDKPDQLKNGITNGELRSTVLAYQNQYVPCLESRLESIKELYGAITN